MASKDKAFKLLVGAAGAGCAIAFVATTTLRSVTPAHRSCPSEKARHDTFDSMARKWDKTVRFDEFWTGIGRARRRLVQRASGDVLEVAVGTGRNFSYYNSAKVKSLTGIDFSRGMLEVADSKRLDLEPIPLRLKLSSSQKMDFEDNSFDAVVDTFGVCSFEDPVKALQEMRRVVKEDGQVLLLEHGASSWELVQGMLNRATHQHVDKYGCYPNRKIDQLVKEAGLHVVVEVRRHFGSEYTLVCTKNPPTGVALAE